MIPEDDDKAYGLFEQACSVEQSYFAAAAGTIGTELIIKKHVFSWPSPILRSSRRVADQSTNRLKGLGPPDTAKVAQAEADLEEVLVYYEKLLAKQTYLAGSELTLVDLFHLPNGSALKAFGYKGTFAKYLNVDRWFAELQERETWVMAAVLAGTAV